MAEDGLLHTTELLKTALPYVGIRSRLTLELLVKLYELIICMRNFMTNDISACGFENEKTDMEALLNSIRPKCNKQEQAFVDKFLSIFQAKRMFEMYITYMETMNAMEGFEGFAGSFHEGSQGNGFADIMNSFKDFDFTSVFSDNKETAAYIHPDIDSEYAYTEINDTDNTSDMFDSIKSMVPPDQMETFEKLRMLFGLDSYDDNKKPDENKE